MVNFCESVDSIIPMPTNQDMINTILRKKKTYYFDTINFLNLFSQLSKEHYFNKSKDQCITFKQRNWVFGTKSNI